MNFWAGKKVMVTGCSGLIGGPVCRLLLERGAEIMGVDLNGEGTLDAHGIKGKFPMWLGDIMDYNALLNATVGYDVVIHLAANSGVEESRRDTRRAYELNIMGTVNVLEAARERGVGAVVIASSNHVYGKQAAAPFYEEAPLNQLDVYSVSKIAADYITRSYYHNFDLWAGCLRNTNCYGIGDPHMKHIIPGTIATILDGDTPIIKSLGRTKKAYLYVDDVAEAYLAMGKYLYEGGDPGSGFNISTESVSVFTLVDTIGHMMESLREPIIMGEENDQNDEYLDWTRARELLGWEPAFSLKQGLEKTIEWYRSERWTKV
jgi:CDP-glucose 4,6-dehydratase